MSVYIEYVVIDNLVIDFIVLYLVALCMQYKIAWYKLFFSACLGTFMAVVFPMLTIPMLLSLFCKFMLSVFMVLIIKRPKSLKAFGVSLGLFYVFTWLLGGMIYALIWALGGDFISSSALTYSAPIPVGVLLAIAVVYGVILAKIARKMYKVKHMQPFIKKVELYALGVRMQFVAYVDSGNRLFDASSHLPVVVVQDTVLEKCLGTMVVDALFEGKLKNAPDLHFLPIHSVGGESTQIPIFYVEKCLIDGVPVMMDFYVGVTRTKFEDAVKYEALLHPSLV